MIEARLTDAEFAARRVADRTRLEVVARLAVSIAAVPGAQPVHERPGFPPEDLPALYDVLTIGEHNSVSDAVAMLTTLESGATNA